MKHFIIGSRLMVQLFPDNQRIQKRLKPNADYDILIDHEPTSEDKKYFKDLYGPKTECHYIPILWHFLSVQEIGVWDMKNVYFTLKCSHVAFDKVHKKKTFYDIWLMSQDGCKIMESLFYDLYNFWTEKFGEKWRADFTQESADFFDDAVSRENVHDELHETVKIFDKPAFRFLQDEGQTTVYVCPKKFNDLPFEKQVAVIIEEARVLAIERELTTKNGIKSQYIAYLKWLEAMVDRIAPLWQVPFILNNFYYFTTLKQKYYDI